MFRHHFSQGKEFDRVLYRAGPSTPAYDKGKKVLLHPMIEKTDGIFAKLEDARMLVWDGDDVKEHFPKDYPTVLDEYATRPASTQIDIEIEDAPRERLPLLVKSTGISVRDFFEHLAKFWSTPVSAQNAEYGMAEFGIKNAKDVNYTHILGAHYAWTTWLGGVAQGGNRTKVRAGPFDS